MKRRKAVDLKSLRSAIVIEGGDAVADYLRRRLETAPPAPDGHTMIKLDDDGRPVVSKGSGAKAPKRASKASLPGKKQLRELMESREIPWDDDAPNRLQAYNASDETVDRQGDIVLQNWELERFRRTSPMPWSHGWESLPVGRIIDERVIEAVAGGKAGGTSTEPAGEARRLWLLGLFAREGDYPFADTVRRLVQSGIVTSGSVGFISNRIVRVEDKKEREALGLGEWGAILDKNELLEFSPCTIGANPNAQTERRLSTAARKGLVAPVDVMALREIRRRELARSGSDRKGETWDEADELMLEIGRGAFPDFDFGNHGDLEDPIEGLGVDRTTSTSVRFERIPGDEEALEDETAEIEDDLDAEAPQDAQDGDEAQGDPEAGDDPEAIKEAVSELVERSSDRLKGEELGSTLAGILDEYIDDDDERDLETAVAELAEASGLEVEDVEALIEGSGACPAFSTLEAFAEVLSANVDTLRAAAEADGCEYDTEDEDDDQDDETRDLEPETDESPTIRELLKKVDKLERAVETLLSQVEVLGAKVTTSGRRSVRDLDDLRSLVESVLDSTADELTSSDPSLESILEGVDTDDLD